MAVYITVPISSPGACKEYPYETPYCRSCENWTGWCDYDLEAEAAAHGIKVSDINDGVSCKYYDEREV